MKRFRSSTKAQMSAICILIVVVSISAISTILFAIYNANYKETTLEHKQEALNQLQYSTDAYLDELNRLTLTCMSNGYILERLTEPTPETSIEKLNRSREIETFLDEIMITQRQDILGVYLFLVDEQEIYASTRYLTSINHSIDYNDLTWYQDVLNSGNWLIVPPHFNEFEQNHASEVFSLVRVIINPKTLSPVAVIEVNANTKVLDNLLSQVDVGDYGHLVLIDKDNRVFYSNTNPSDNIENFLAQYPDNEVWGNVGGIRYVYNRAEKSAYGLTLQSYSSTEDLENMKYQQLLVTGIVTTCCCAVALIASLVFTSKFLKPMLQIYNLMKQVENGNSSVRYTGNRTDEMGYLGQRFNSMLGSINQAAEENTRLLTELFEGKVLQTQAQVNALQAQIKPHFMCNTLNMISMMVQCGENDSAVKNINRMSYLMRSITDFRDIVPLQRELAVLHAYLDIQNDRFGNRIQYREAIDPSLYNYLIPTLTLQPVVENAMKHGCEKTSSVTCINIYSQIFADNVDIIVEDNACGMSPQRLDEVRKSLISDETDFCKAEPKGVGLSNIHSRLRLIYGERFGISIDSTLGVGTKVTIHLPPMDSEKSKLQEEK